MNKYILLYFGLVICLLSVSVHKVSAQWLNTVSGNVHVEGRLDPNVPTPPPNRFFSSSDAVRGESGIITYTDNTTNESDFGANGGSQTDSNWSVNLPDNSAINRIISRYNFGYYLNKYTGSFAADHPGHVNINVCNLIPLKPPTGPQRGDVIRVRGDFRILGQACDIGIAENESFILLVDGEVEIRSRTYGVSPNAYFIVIAQGNITFHRNTGSTGGSIQGTYVTDSIISLPATANIFRGDGVFIAHSAVDPNRTGPGPSEQFRYEPRFLINANLGIKRRQVSNWESLNP
ncbi:hypothetical protein HY469_03695 [Candidatus Roizmanbacteria bacterium]|nr:hypothetical protein [Candidatus Roizmanbacteria bacterium]